MCCISYKYPVLRSPNVADVGTVFAVYVSLVGAVRDATLHKMLVADLVCHGTSYGTIDQLNC